MFGSEKLVYKVLVVDDDVFNREGLRLYLEESGYEVYEAADVAAAKEVAKEKSPNVAIVDIVMPMKVGESAQSTRSAGIELARYLKKLDPAMGIVIFSAHDNRGSDVWNMVRDGMRGMVYKLKGCPPSAIKEAIQEALAGRVLIDQDVLINPRTLVDELLAQLAEDERPFVTTAVSQLDELTPRESEIGRRLAASHSIQGIADALGISTKTVENHVSHIYGKLNLTDLMADEGPSLRKVVILAKAHMIKELERLG